MNRLDFPNGSRPWVLLNELDRRFLFFLSILPESLATLASQNGTFLGAPDPSPFGGVVSLNPVLAGMPWLFWEEFSSFDNDTFLTIAEAGASFVLASILLDHLIDHQAENPGHSSLLHQALYEHGVHLYRGLLPSPHWFWDQFERLALDHMKGLGKELLLQDGKHEVGWEDLEIMAHGKVSPIVVTVAALATLSDKQALLKPIEDSLKHIAIASQLLDDIGDWEDDLNTGHLTFYLQQVASDLPQLDSEKVEAFQVQRRIDLEWQDVNYLKRVMEFLKQSKDSVSGIQCSGWIEYIDDYIMQTEEHLDAAMARHLLGVLRKVSP